MGVQFNHPWFLLLLIPLAVFAVYAFRGPARIPLPRHRLAAGLRTAALLLLVLLLAGTQLYTVQRQHEVVYAVDRSASSADSEEDREWISASLEGKGEKDEFAVLSFGRDASAEQTLTGSGDRLTSLAAAVDPDYTNVQRALQLASGMLGTGDPRIVLISDGSENAGSMLSAGKLLKNRGIKVDVLEKESGSGKDAAIDSLSLPERLYLGESFSAEAEIRSTFGGTAVVRLYEDNMEIGSQTVNVEQGDTRVLLQGIAKKPGLHRYRAELSMPGDGQSANNAAFAFTRVAGSPAVLIVEGKPGTSGNISKALNAGLVDTTVISPEMLPSELADYAVYDSVIFNNVSADKLGQAKMDLIETAVRSYGIGFMMSGGDQSFGLGGYFETPIERALPVSMELEGKREVPELGLILVIDRSGSMDGSKIELAKEAAMRTVELMRAKDTVGVVAFDDSPWWVVEPQKLADKEEVLEQIQSIPSGGGTNIYPALQSAAERMKEIKAQRKHIILLTDGQSAGGGSYEDLLGELGAENVTVSSVAVGSDADRRLLEEVARLGKGRFYDVQDETTLPAIFSREAVLLARTYIVNKPFTPAIADAGDWAPLFANGLPQIEGYIATSAKPSAQTALASPEPDPLLVRWQYGSGRTVAWTSDLTGEWSGHWVSWDKFANVLTQTVKWTFPQFTASPYRVETAVGENGLELNVSVSAGETETLPAELSASFGGDGGENSEPVTLVQTAPGNYTGVLPVVDPGAYLLNLSPVEPAGSSGDGAAGEKGAAEDNGASGTGAENYSEGGAGEESPASGAAGDAAAEAEDAGSEGAAAGETGAEPAQGGGEDASASSLPASSGTGVVIPYSPEYRIASAEQENGGSLADLAALTGGRVLSRDNPAAVFAEPAAPRKEARDWNSILLAAALALWIADIAVRRLAVPWGRLAAALRAPLAAASGRRAAAASGAAAPAEDGALARLSAAKRRSAAFRGGGKRAAENAAPPPGAAAGSPRAAGGESGSEAGSASAADRARAERGAGRTPAGRPAGGTGGTSGARSAAPPPAAGEASRGRSSSGNSPGAAGSSPDKQPAPPRGPAANPGAAPPSAGSAPGAAPGEASGSAMDRLLAAKKRRDR
ncbi:VWA domain-containing protein [Saccharibacillus sp. CPCC 101409]|uniref:VWA domain-containing protein n=1 Tax=Saccharibacillus sp. CPCC 101409 TaxID=3058041 RepID=UPI00267309F3|nr:VWA domain-containing protein [Saccharibacillus sp. CPCC 101409]MDO3408660.1 VWA domain-containing protein [Saccharibacillus sp. CPCC 101409]